MTDASNKKGVFSDYIALTRLDHSAKHLFIIPGLILAYLLRGIHTSFVGTSIALGFAAAIFIASANYTINEWLDRAFDQYHPTKSQRRAVQRTLNGKIVFLQWALCLVAGLACSYAANYTLFVITSLFALQGVLYNVPPLRSKDKTYLDVLSESVNNPLRLLIGWAMIDPTSLPPSSLILSYWLGGAFLMSAKRLSEYRDIVLAHGKERLVLYRVSFAGYSDISLMVACFVYGLLSSFFLAVFFIKYRIEYILLMPLIIAFFARYLALSLHAESLAQHPERLMREPSLMLLTAALAGMFALTTCVDMPILGMFANQHYIGLK